MADTYSPPSPERATQDPTRPPEEWLTTWTALKEVIDNPSYGPESLTGTVLSVKNRGKPNYSFQMPEEIPQDKLYVVGEVQDEAVPEPIVHKGKIPRPYVRGGIFNFGRPPWYTTRETDPPQTEKRYVLYKLKPTHKDEEGTFVYDELQDIDVLSEADLKIFVEHNNADIADDGSKRAEIPREEHAVLDVRYPSRTINIDPYSSPDVFTSMTDQLEAENIHNWTGLKWKKHWEKQYPTVDNPDGKKTVVRNIEIIRDTVLTKMGGKKDDDTDGQTWGFKPLRVFVMQESDENGVPIAHRVVPVDEHLPTLFSGDIYDMSIEKQDKPLPALEDDLSDRLSEAETALETMPDEDRIAGWLLSYADIVTGDDRESKEKRLAGLRAIFDTHEGERRMGAVKTMLGHYGAARIYDLARVLRDDFVASAGELGLSVDIADTTGTIKTPGSSISWVIEGLADQYYYDINRSKIGEDREGLELGNPFGHDTVIAQHRWRDIVDQRIGSSLVDAVMHWETKPEVKGIDPDTKQPAYEMERKLLFDSKPLEKTPEITRKQVKEREERVYRNTENGKIVRIADLVEIGRLIRRGIGR